ncbi:MAG TPA: hypothetical protein VHC42_06390 [Rhizomicrobium sp.]|nr:hypothetical protein [Rhizomicrobium sp.]
MDDEIVVQRRHARLENAQITEENFGVAVGNLGELQREADRLNLRSAVSQLQSIHDHLFEDRKTLVSVRPLVHDLHLRMGNGFARAVGLLPTYNSRLLLLGIRPRTALGVWQA